MGTQSLAVKYRPCTFSDVVEQNSVKTILLNQLETNTIQHAYLFVGSAGCGKTTSARIFANEINKGQGTPIEIDAASHNGVDDVRMIIDDSKTQSIDSEYKIYIFDECHMLSTAAWNAMLKMLEEPPAKSIYILCTTNPEKIPQTILSRVQRYDFQKISTEGIANRLRYVIHAEYKVLGCAQCTNTYYSDGARLCKTHNSYADKAKCPDAVSDVSVQDEAIEYIAKLANGGMRTAISLMDKCLSYSNQLTVQNVVNALGVADYADYIQLAQAMLTSDAKSAIEVIEEVKSSGKDIKQFVKGYLEFCLDVCKYCACRDFKYIKIPNTPDYKTLLDKWLGCGALFKRYVGVLINLNSDLRWETDPFTLVEATIYLECGT